MNLPARSFLKIGNWLYDKYNQEPVPIPEIFTRPYRTGGSLNYSAFRLAEMKKPCPYCGGTTRPTVNGRCTGCGGPFERRAQAIEPGMIFYIP